MLVSEQAVQAALEVIENGHEITEDYMLSALTAALPFLTGVKVKALEWENSNPDRNDIWACLTDDGFEINRWWEDGNSYFEVGKNIDVRHDTLEAAKAAAQADYEARIMSALEPFANSYPQGASLAAQSKNEDGSYKEPSPRAQALEPDFWSVHSKTGVHIGLWPIKAHAYEALREYEGGTITPLYRATHDQEEGFRQGIEASAKLAEYFEETIYSEGMTEDVYYGISCTVSQVIREIRALSSQPVAERTQCERCQGNGEVVTDWDRYKHPHATDVGDEAVAECPDCSGYGFNEAKYSPVADGWLPIETAPKDGTQILIEVHPGIFDVVCWSDNAWREGGNFMRLRKEPTHWRPLPASPGASE